MEVPSRRWPIRSAARNMPTDFPQGITEETVRRRRSGDRHRSGGPRGSAFAMSNERGPYLAMFGIHFALAGVNAIVAAFFPSAVWAYTALGLFISLCFGVLKTSPATFILFVPLLALRVTEFLSGAAIESGAFMTETQTIGHATGAFSRLLLVYIPFLAVVAAVTEAKWPKLRREYRGASEGWEKHAKLIWNALLLAAGLATLFLVGLGLKNGFPLLAHIDRFAYERQVDSPIYGGFIRNRLVLVPFVGALLALPGYRVRAAAYTVWLLGISILFGEKFTSLVMILSMVGIPAVLIHVANNRPIPVRTLGLGTAAIVAITIPAVLMAYGAASNLDLALKKYQDRAALQGQLWYQVDKSYGNLVAFDANAISADTATWFAPSWQDPSLVRTDFGRYYVMKQFTPVKDLLGLMTLGSGFVFSLYPYLLMTTGVFGMILVSTFLALYHAFIMFFLSRSLARANWVAALLFGRVVNSIYATYADGYLWNVFGIKTLITIALALFFMWQLDRPDRFLGSIVRALSGERSRGRRRRSHRTRRESRSTNTRRI